MKKGRKEDARTKQKLSIQKKKKRKKEEEEENYFWGEKDKINSEDSDQSVTRIAEETSWALRKCELVGKHEEGQ